MAVYAGNIKTLFRLAFGEAEGIILAIDGNKPAPLPSPYNSIPIIATNAQSIPSLLGTPIYEQIYFRHPAFGEISFPDAALVQVKSAKEIIKTKVTGRKGTVKELISQGDDEITMKGFLNNLASNDYPDAMLRDFYKLLNVNDNITVISPYLNAIGISTIVIEEGEPERIEGMPNLIPYTIKAVSDFPVELQILNDSSLAQITRPILSSGSGTRIV